MVSASECPKLRRPTLLCPVGHLARKRALHRAVCFRTLEVARLAITLLNHPPCSTTKHVVDLSAFQLHASFRSSAAGDIPKDLIDQLLHPRLHIGSSQRGPYQPHAAIDIESDPARRYNAFFDIRGRDTADGEPVPLMDVRHRQTWPDDTGQCGHIHRLHERLISLYLFNKDWAREHEDVSAHAGSFVSCNAISVVV